MTMDELSLFDIYDEYFNYEYSMQIDHFNEELNK